MVFYSTKSNEKVFHLPHCRIRKRIRKENDRYFISPEEARAQGYRICNCCCQMATKLRKEQEAVNQFCQANGISYHLEDGQLHIQTKQSDWRIIVKGKSHKLFLYHKNAYKKPEAIPSIIPGYHSQAAREDTILGYLQYIVEHDAFRQHQKNINIKKKQTRSNLRKNTRKFQHGRANARFSANQLYSILDDVYV